MGNLCNSPKSFFDFEYYFRINKDLSLFYDESDTNGLWRHWVEHGYKECRDHRFRVYFGVSKIKHIPCTPYPCNHEQYINTLCGKYKCLSDSSECDEIDGFLVSREILRDAVLLLEEDFLTKYEIYKDHEKALARVILKCISVGNIDADGDGFTPNEGDCDDNNPQINPNAEEVFDGIDNNCNGLVDEKILVTVGAYEFIDCEYVDRNADLTYEVGATCQIWSRTAQAHEGYPEPHPHWNAQSNSTYVNGVFTWTEFGPYHTEQEVVDACGSNTNPSEPKSVTAEEYTEFQPGLFLRIKEITYDTYE